MKWLHFRGREQSRLQDQSCDQELLQALKEAHAEILALRAKVAEYHWLEECLRDRTRELNERMKELDCLYAIASCLTKDHLPLERILSSIASQIPYGWQAPKATCARIVLNGKEYTSTSFRKTAKKQTVPIRVNGKKAGRIEVYLLPELRWYYDISFLNEELNLLQTIALWVGNMLSYRNNTRHALN